MTREEMLSMIKAYREAASDLLVAFSSHYEDFDIDVFVTNVMLNDPIEETMLEHIEYLDAVMDNLTKLKLM